MAEEDQVQQPQEAAPAPEQKAKPKPKHKKKAKAKAAAPASAAKLPPPKSPKSTGPSSGVLIAVYVVLGLLVLALTFYTGYLFGKSATGSGSTTQTGSAQNGKLQIIEYSDFQCPFCGRVEPTVEQLRKEYGDKIDLQYKEFPLDSIHPYALGAAIAAECARDQGKFWEYHDKLFANQQALDIPQLKQYAQDLGLDTAKFNTCLDNKETLSRVQADQQEGISRGVQGTPSFWIKDELVVGAQPYAVFKQKIDDKLAGKAAPAPAPQQQQQPTAPAGPVKVDAGTHILGNANAKVTIVEFSDYQCPFCKRYYEQNEQQLITEYVNTGKVRFAFRNFPLPFHQNAEIAAEAAECAGAQGKYFEYHNVLFTKGNGDGTGLDAASLKQYAADLKLDTAKFNSCLDGGQMKAVVTKDQADGSTAGVQGTPTSFVNGVAVVGAVPYTQLKAAIDAELAK